MIISPASPLCWARGLTRHVNANQSKPMAQVNQIMAEMTRFLEASKWHFLKL